MNYSIFLLSHYLKTLLDAGFEGGIAEDRVTCFVYQPGCKAVLFPKHAADLALAKKIAADHPAVRIPEDVWIDKTRYLIQIISLDSCLQTVTFQAGLNRDALNAQLKEKGWICEEDFQEIALWCVEITLPIKPILEHAAMVILRHRNVAGAAQDARLIQDYLNLKTNTLSPDQITLMRAHRLFERLAEYLGEEGHHEVPFALSRISISAATPDELYVVLTRLGQLLSERKNYDFLGLAVLPDSGIQEILHEFWEWATSSIKVRCPTYLKTRHRVFSPEGRARLIQAFESAEASGIHDAELGHAVFSALKACEECWGCQARENIPKARLHFLQKYYERHWRSPKVWIETHRERVLRYPIGRVFYALWKRYPWPAHQHFCISDEHRLKNANPERSVIVLQDSLMTAFDSQSVLGVLETLKNLGFDVHVWPVWESALPLLQGGAWSEAKALLAEQYSALEALARWNIPIVGLNPVSTLPYRDEYQWLEPRFKNISVLLPQEFLYDAPVNTSFLKEKFSSHHEYYLWCDAKERAKVPDAELMWIQLFARWGVQMSLIPEGKTISEYSKSPILATGFEDRMKLKRQGVLVKYPLG